jgi:hypothetical protein
MDMLSITDRYDMPFVRWLGMRFLTAAPERVTAEMIVHRVEDEFPRTGASGYDGDRRVSTLAPRQAHHGLADACDRGGWAPHRDGYPNATGDRIRACLSARYSGSARERPPKAFNVSRKLAKRASWNLGSSCCINTSFGKERLGETYTLRQRDNGWKIVVTTIHDLDTIVRRA